MKEVVSPEDFKGKVDFGIITIREDEFQAVLRRLPTNRICKGKQIYSLSTLLTSNQDTYLTALVRCPEQGNLQGQSVAQKLIDELDPQWILLVGIAGSIPDSEYTLGDVLIANRLYDFCVSASFDDKPDQFNVRGGAMHPEIQNLIAGLPLLETNFERWNTSKKVIAARPKVNFKQGNFYGDDEWKSKTKSSLKKYFGASSVRKIPKVFTGSVASSDTLVKDTNLVKEWQQAARQVAGIEMELAGVYQAAHDTQKPVLAIRGISDVVGFRRSPEWTEYACHTAASLTIALLKSRPINPREVDSALAKDKLVEAPGIRPANAFTQIPKNIPALKKQEKLFSNLLEVTYFPEQMYSVKTACKDRSEIWLMLREEIGTPPEDWVYHGQILYAFHPFDDPIWKKIIGTETAESNSTSNWSATDDTGKTNIFVELLKSCLKELGRTRDLSYRHKRPLRFLFFSPTEDLSPRKIVTRSLKRDGTHTVFKGYTDRRTGAVMYYRHHAFRFDFTTIDSKWYLQISPTYHYTWNGWKLYFYYEDQISGIKRQENNEAVFRQVLFWAEVLTRNDFMGEQSKYPFLEFGSLIEFPFPYGVIDTAWAKKESLRKISDEGDSLFR